MATIKVGFACHVTEVLSHRYTAPNQPAILPYAITPDNLVVLCRAKVKATLTELTKIVEALPGANSETESQLPYMGLFFSDPLDVSAQFAVNSQASTYQVEHVYVAKTVQDSATDTTQALRARLDILETAYYADPKLGGLVTLTSTVDTPANKANTYAQAFATDGQLLSVMVLTMQFTLVKDIPHA
jgi:hypothetical protein